MIGAMRSMEQRMDRYWGSLKEEGMRPGTNVITGRIRNLHGRLWTKGGMDGGPMVEELGPMVMRQKGLSHGEFQRVSKPHDCQGGRLGRTT